MPLQMPEKFGRLQYQHHDSVTFAPHLWQHCSCRTTFRPATPFLAGRSRPCYYRRAAKSLPNSVACAVGFSSSPRRPEGRVQSQANHNTRGLPYPICQDVPRVESHPAWLATNAADLLQQKPDRKVAFCKDLCITELCTHRHTRIVLPEISPKYHRKYRRCTQQSSLLCPGLSRLPRLQSGPRSSTPPAIRVHATYIRGSSGVR